eukprot:87988-Prymnesium_polylepis.1
MPTFSTPPDATGRLSSQRAPRRAAAPSTPRCAAALRAPLSSLWWRCPPFAPIIPVAVASIIAS